MRSAKHQSSWAKVGGMAVVREPLDDRRTRPVYHDTRGMTALATGGRKRQIHAPS